MAAAHLKTVLEHERHDDTFYEPLPFHYMEIGFQLLDMYAAGALRVRLTGWVAEPLMIYRSISRSSK